jgi:L-cysteine/cystine lyase
MSALVFHADARRFDTASVIGSAGTWALASLEVLAEAGPELPTETGPRLAAALAQRLTERGVTVAPRGASTLVSWEADDPEQGVSRLAANGVVVRSIIQRGLVRASVGAWNSEDDLDRLIGHAV